MAGKVTVNSLQVGDSSTATQNLVLRTNGNGTFTIARGNDGATTQDILTIDATGRIAMPQSQGPSFLAYRTAAAAALTSGVWSLIACDTEVYDSHGCYDPTSTWRFTPTVAGYYLLVGSTYVTQGTVQTIAGGVFKNGTQVLFGGFSSMTGAVSVAAGLVYMNGTTDYANLYAYGNGTSPQIQPGVGLTTFHGTLVHAT